MFSAEAVIDHAPDRRAAQRRHHDGPDEDGETLGALGWRGSIHHMALCRDEHQGIA